MIAYPSGTILIKKVNGTDDFEEDYLEADDVPVSSSGSEFTDISISGDNIQDLFSSMAEVIGELGGLSNPLANDDWLMWKESTSTSGVNVLKLDSNNDVLLNSPIMSGSVFIQHQGVNNWEFTYDGDLVPMFSGAQVVGGPSNYLDTLYTDSLVWRTPVFPNHQWVFWRDFADSEDVPIIRLADDDHTYIRAKDTSHHIIFDMPTIGTLAYFKWGSLVMSNSNSIKMHDTTNYLGLSGGDGVFKSGGAILLYGNTFTTISRRGAIHLNAGDAAANDGGFIQLENGRKDGWVLPNEASYAGWLWQGHTEGFVGYDGDGTNKDLTLTCNNLRDLSDSPYIRLFDNIHFTGQKGGIILAAGNTAANGNVDVWTSGSSSFLFTYSGTLEPAANLLYDIGRADRVIAEAFIDTLSSCDQISSAGTEIDILDDLDLNGKSINKCTNLNAGVGTNLLINNNTISGSDNQSIVIIPGGTSSNYNRAAFLELHGIDGDGAGDVRLGAAVSGRILLYQGGTSTGSNRLVWNINGNKLSNNNATEDDTYLEMYVGASGYSSSMQTMGTSRTASSGFDFIVTAASGDTQHILDGNGDVYIDGTLYQNQADYAEYFELKDEEIADVADVVVLDGDRVRVFASGVDSLADIIGVVRPTGGSLTANHPLNWPGKYEKDSYGTYALDSAGNRVVTSGYDSEQDPYIPRSKRAEWVVVGLVGQVIVKTSSNKPISWRKMKDINESLELWFIR